MLVLWRRMFAIACVAACSYAPSRIAADDDIDGPPGDLDNDGVTDPLDNCPTTPNPDQHDEDGDGTGDVCDPCPHLAGTAADADADGDGIGDGCDPRPTLAGDQLVSFETFADGNGLPSGWTSIAGAAGNWTVADDAMVNTALAATQMVMVDVGAGPRSIDIGVEVTAANAVIDTIGVGAFIDGNGTQSTMYMCFVQSVSTSQFTLLFGPGTTAFAIGQPGPVLPGRYRIATYYDGAQLRCRFGGLNAPADLTSAQPSLGNTQVGIRLRNTAVKIEYVAIYRSP